jgi:hypothetical protein
VAGGAKDPEGAFTSACLLSASPGPLQAVAGRERASATTLESPVMCQIVGANSAMNDR